MVSTSQKDFLSTLSSTQDHRSIALKLEVSNSIEHLWEVSTSEVHACHLIVCLQARILHDMCQFDCIFHLCRYVEIVHISLVILVTIEELNVIRCYEIGIQPLVKLAVAGFIRLNNTGAVQFILTTSSEGHTCHRQQ